MPFFPLKLFGLSGRIGQVACLGSVLFQTNVSILKKTFWGPLGVNITAAVLCLNTQLLAQLEAQGPLTLFVSPEMFFYFLSGKSKEDSMNEYIKLVEQLKQKYGV